MNGQTLEQLQQQQYNPYQPPMPEFLTKEDKELLKRTLLAKFPEDQQQIFIRRCERAKLDPFSGQIHPTSRNVKIYEDGQEKWVPKLVTVTGIYGLLATAIRTGDYEGTELSWCGSDGVWKPEWLDRENYPEAARAIVYVRHRKPETGIARWFSFVQEIWDKKKEKWFVTDMWERMPDFMLGKCGRALALRAAFPDQLSEIYITEELRGLPELDVDADAAKIAENQRREKEVVIPGARVVESTGKRPTPDEALEPAFDEDKIPPKPSMAEQLKRDFPQAATVSAQTQVKPTPPAPAAAAPEPTEEDNLDFGAPAQGGTATAGSSPTPAPEPAWKSHVLKGITNARFFGRKLGDLNEVERGVLETQWLPKIQEQWEKANEAQRADYPMVQAAIAYHKLAKPWQA